MELVYDVDILKMKLTEPLAAHQSSCFLSLMTSMHQVFDKMTASFFLWGDTGSV